MKDNHKSYQLELVDFSSSRQEVDLIKSRIEKQEVSDLCNDIYQALCRYRILKNHKISRQRRLDLNALEGLVSDSSEYQTKEECMEVIEQRLQRIKTRLFNFRRNSLLRNMIREILSIYNLPQLKKASNDLELEMRAHDALAKKFHLTVGDDIDRLRTELVRSKQTIAVLEQQNQELREKIDYLQGNHKANHKSNNSNNDYLGFLGKKFK